MADQTLKPTHRQLAAPLSSLAPLPWTVSTPAACKYQSFVRALQCPGRDGKAGNGKGPGQSCSRGRPRRSRSFSNGASGRTLARGEAGRPDEPSPNPRPARTPMPHAATAPTGSGITPRAGTGSTSGASRRAGSLPTTSRRLTGKHLRAGEAKESTRKSCRFPIPRPAGRHTTCPEAAAGGRVDGWGSPLAWPSKGAPRRAAPTGGSLLWIQCAASRGCRVSQIYPLRAAFTTPPYAPASSRGRAGTCPLVSTCCPCPPPRGCLPRPPATPVINTTPPHRPSPFQITPIHSARSVTTSCKLSLAARA
jgi:hypothetical protein